jgi:K+-transporting ATPase KdpF subunit
MRSKGVVHMPGTGDTVALLVGVLLLGYLVWTLLFPERF